MIKEEFVVSISDRSIGNLIAVNLTKEEKQALVIFDTGASVTVLSKTTAEKFKAQETRKKAQAGGTAGFEQEINFSTLEGVHLGEYVIPTGDCIVVDDEVLIFGKDEEGNDLRVDGFLGWDVISRLRWEYNNEKSEFSFGEPMVSSYQNTFEEWDNMPILNVVMENQNRVFGFDSGHTESVIGNVLFSNYSHLESKSDEFVGLDGQSTETVRIVDKFELSINNKNIELRNISVVNREVFPARRKDICGLLGIDIVENRNWILDYPNRIFDIL